VDLLTFLSVGFCSLSLANSRTSPPLRYTPTIDVAQYALHQGDARSANLVEGFIPLYQSASNAISFADIRFYNPNGTPLKWNADLGFRYLFHKNTQLFGLYAGYDRYKSETSNYYNQANLGIEYWYKKLFLGANGYLPFGTTSYDNDSFNSAFLVSTGTSYRYNIAFAAGKERALPGGDAEIGYDITHHLTVYAGGYYFDHSDVSSISGPKLRATYTFYRAKAHRLLRVFDRIRLEGLISYDSTRGTSWLAGLRFSFGLLKDSNPTTGLARHMVDPIRRDLNVINEGYTNPSSELYRIDGEVAQIDIVSDTSGRTMEDAIDDEDVHVIGVRDSQDITGTLTLGDRDLVITGAKFDFETNGSSYTVSGVGQNGTLTYDTVSLNLFDLEDSDGTHTVTLERLTIEGADEAGFALQTDGNAFGQMIVDHVTSNTPFDFILTDTDATGAVTFTHNELDLVDSEAVDANVGNFAGVIFFADTDALQLDVSNFSNNSISIIGRTVDSDPVMGLFTEGISTNPLNFTHDISKNTIMVNENGDDGYSWYLAPGTLVVGGNVNGNTFMSSENGAIGYGWYITSSITIGGNVSGNTITASDNTGNGYGWWLLSSMTIEGNISDNTFRTLTNVDGIGWWLFSTFQVNGNITGNAITSSGNTDDGYGWWMLSTATIDGNISGNTITTSDNTDLGYGWYISGGTTTVGGNVRSNTFTSSNSTTSDGIGWLIESDTTIGGTVSTNHFISSGNVGDDRGISIETSVGADVVIFEQAVRGNMLRMNGSLSGDYGFYLDASGGGTIDFDGNSAESELISSNNDAGLFSGGGDINYNG
jgi:hypothetical protein